MADVMLIDGVGTPRRVRLAEDPLPPAIRCWGSFTPPVGVRRPVTIDATFDQCAEQSLDGLPVYRQRQCGTPLIRYDRLRPDQRGTPPLVMDVSRA